MEFDVVILGHIAKDKLIINGIEKDAVGGAVYYGALALAQLGFRTGVITMLAKEDWSSLDAFKRGGVDFFATEASATSGIKNTYLSGNNLNERVCEPLAFAGEFSEKMIPDIKTKTFHIGPIMAGEVSLPLIEIITSRFDKVSLDLQGVLRIRRGKDLIFLDWPEKAHGLRNIHTIKADSVEAEVITGEKDLVKAAKMISGWGPQEVLITHKDGVMVYVEGSVFEASFTPKAINGRTGRGDTCISTYLAARLKMPAGEACNFAAAATTLKLEKEGPLECTYQDVMARL